MASRIKYYWVDDIKSSERSANIDKTVFTKWEMCEIDIFECIDLFRRNNRMRYRIEPEMFEQWLNSLGYWRSMQCEEE